MKYLNAWIEVDLTDYTATQITNFFNIIKDSAAYNNLSRPKKLVLQCYWQAKPNRLYRSKTNAKKWLVYVHFPASLADELASLPTTITDNVRFVTRNLKNIPDDVQIEYFGEAINLEVGRYKFLNKFYGVDL